MLLDNIYTSNINLSSTHVCNLFLADHYATICSIASRPLTVNVGQEQHHLATCFCSLKKLNIADFLADVSTYRISQLIDLPDVNSMVVAFCDVFISAWDKHAPLITRLSRHRIMPWITEELLNCYHKYNKAYRNYLKSNKTTECTMNYKLLQNEVACRTCVAKQEFFLRGAKSGSKSFRYNIKNCTGYGKFRSFIHPWLNVNSSLAQRLANSINSFLGSVVSNLTSNFALLHWNSDGEDNS